MKIEQVVEKFEKIFKDKKSENNDENNLFIIHSSNPYLSIFANLLLKQQKCDFLKVSVKEFTVTNEDYETVLKEDKLFEYLKTLKEQLNSNSKAFLLLENAECFSDTKSINKLKKFHKDNHINILLIGNNNISDKFAKTYPALVENISSKDLIKLKSLEFIHKKQNKTNYLNSLGIENFTINDDLTVDVEGDVDISNKGIYDINIKFNKVTGNFNCSDNNIRDYINLPKSVGGTLNLTNNRLDDIDDFLIIVGKDFKCEGNDISSLKVENLTIGGNLSIHHYFQKDTKFEGYYENDKNNDNHNYSKKFLLNIPFETYKNLVSLKVIDNELLENTLNKSSSFKI